jgi:uncharacterized protein (TIGR01244 family)
MSLEIRKLNESISVTSQITADDIVEIKVQGFTAIINNRHDGEIKGQPSAARSQHTVGVRTQDSTVSYCYQFNWDELLTDVRLR